MTITTLLYHDVVSAGDCDSSGFPGAGPNVYKMDRVLFQEHLDAIQRTAPSPPGPVYRVLEPGRHGKPKHTLLTFDDGGSSGYTIIADMLEERSWVGHYLVTTERIGSKGFLSAKQVRELHCRGAVIGSHTHSHPSRLSSLSYNRLVEEWKTSCAILSDILSAPVDVASVAGGYFSTEVAEAADDAGIRILFNSEPVTSMKTVGACHVLGRFSLKRGVAASEAAAIVSGSRATHWKHRGLWGLKEGVKAVSGELWPIMRRQILNRTATSERYD